MLKSAPMVVLGKKWEDIGSDEKEMLNGQAEGSEQR